MEECFQQAKNDAGLDHYQVRSWRAWYAHITLSMLALAWLSATRAQAAKGEPEPADPGMIGYTLPEIRRLLTGLTWRYYQTPHVLAWSNWRRKRNTKPGSTTRAAMLTNACRLKVKIGESRAGRGRGRAGLPAATGQRRKQHSR